MIIAIDPGNVTGFALLTEDTLTVETVEVPGGLYGAVDWWRMHILLPPSMVFIEDFVINATTHRKTREPAAYELVGYFKGWCRNNMVQHRVYGASEHTPFSGYKKKSTSKIHRLGWSTPSKDMHADSAASILLLGMVREYPATARQLLKEIANAD